ncbi:MAG: 3D domain-containing protein [Clostridium perfringens]|nr:3D domain-containing protein [Clostridium perfringens]
MNKKLISLLVVAGLMFNTSTLVMAAPLDSSTTTTTQTSSNSNSSLSDNKAKYQELDNKVTSLSSNIDSLQGQIEQLNNTLKQNAIDIENVKSEITSAQSNIDSLKSEIAKDQEVLGQRIRGLYMLDSSQNALTYLITSNNFGEFLSRVNALASIYSADKQLIDELNTKQNQLNSNLNTLQEKEDSLNTLNNSTKTSIDELTSKQTEYQNQIDELNKEKDQVASTITANEEELISNSVSIINSSNSVSEIQSAVNSLKNIVGQLNIESVITKANNAISQGNSKIERLSQDEEAPSSSTSSSTTSNSTSSAIVTSDSTNSNTSSDNSSTSASSGSYKAEYSMVATAYTGGGLTAMGLKPVRNPDGISTIAVDPSVIPLGSKVYIPGYGYAIASDTGGAIKGDKIDLYMNSESACLNFGRQTVKLYVVAYPGQW